jgi:hypothetical protein
MACSITASRTTVRMVAPSGAMARCRRALRGESGERLADIYRSTSSGYAIWPIVIALARDRVIESWIIKRLGLHRDIPD